MVVEEQAQRGKREPGRNEQHRPASVARLVSLGLPLPRGEGEQRHREEVTEVAHSARVARPVGDLDGVHAVGDSEQQEPGSEHKPNAVDLPTPQRQRADDQRRQQQVPDRVGKLGRHGYRTTSRRGEHLVEYGRRSDGRQAGARDDPVEPHARRQAPLPPEARESHDSGIAERIEAQPEAIADRRDRWAVEIPDPKGPQHVSHGVQRQAGGEDGPRHSLGLDLERT